LRGRHSVHVINLRAAHVGIINGCWLNQGGPELRVRGEGQFVLNTIDLVLDAAMYGHRLAHLQLDQRQLVW